jgi:hypothetical protein
MPGAQPHTPDEIARDPVVRQQVVNYQDVLTYWHYVGLGR